MDPAWSKAFGPAGCPSSARSRIASTGSSKMPKRSSCFGASRIVCAPEAKYPDVVDRQPPRVTSNAIDLYVRTYYSLLRSSGEVRVRAFEESHVFSDSSLHSGARDERPDIAAFAYATVRLPACMLGVHKLVVGQSIEQFAT